MASYLPPHIGGHILIPWMPQHAYRILIDLLGLDTTFCNHVIPYFHNQGLVTLYIHEGGHGYPRTHPELRAGSDGDDTRVCGQPPSIRDRVDAGRVGRHRHQYVEDRTFGQHGA